MQGRPLRFATFRNKSVHDSSSEQTTHFYLDSICNFLLGKANQPFIASLLVVQHQPNDQTKLGQTTKRNPAK